MGTATEHRRTFVLDTSVLLSDPKALFAFKEHHVVLPLVVVTELEKKRNDPVLGHPARQVLRALEQHRTAGRGELSKGVVVTPEGGTLRIETNHVDKAHLPDGLRREDSNDVRILAVAKALDCEDEGTVTVVSKDLPMRIRADAVLNLTAEEYLNEQVHDTGWTGIETVTAPDAVIQGLFDKELLEPWDETTRDAPTHTGLIVTGYGDNRSALAVKRPDKMVELLHAPKDLFGVQPRSAAQQFAAAHLANTDVPIVSLGGVAGTGKTALAIAAGLQAVMEDRTHDRVVVYRSTHVVGGEQIGFLPGTVEEKIDPLADAVHDVVSSLMGKDTAKEIWAQGKIEVAPLSYIRGRTLNQWIVIDEAQQLERSTILTALTRVGPKGKIIFTHDVRQRDNLRVGRYDGIAAVIAKLKGENLFGHVELSKAERSSVAELASRVLDPDEPAW